MKRLAIILGTIGIFGFNSINHAAAPLLANEGQSLSKVVIDGQGIDFMKGSWADALAKAKKEDKLIFLDAYASWCGPCKYMARTTFTEEKAGTFFNKNFVNYKMDMEKHPDGPRLSKKYGLEAYPTLYFIDKNEKMVHMSVGALNVKELLAEAQIALR
jgi:thiol:disulfide interchange protein